MGIFLTRLGVGYFLEQQKNQNRRWICRSPLLVRCWYLGPRAAIAWTTNHVDSSTVLACNWRFLGLMDPVWYWQSNVLITGNGSQYKTSRGSKDTFLQKLSHFVQSPLAVGDLIVQRPLKMSSATALIPLWEILCLVGSTSTIPASVGVRYPRRQVVFYHLDPPIVMSVQ